MSLSSLFAPSSPYLNNKLFDEFGIDFTTPSIFLETEANEQQPQPSEFLSANFTNGFPSFLGPPKPFLEQTFNTPPQSRSGSLDHGTAQFSKQTPEFAFTLNSLANAPPSPALTMFSDISHKTNYADLSATLFPINTFTTIPERPTLKPSASQASSTGMAIDFREFGIEFDDMLNMDLSLNMDDIVTFTEAPVDSEISPTNSEVPSLTGFSVGGSVSPVSPYQPFDSLSIPIINVPLPSSTNPQLTTKSIIIPSTFPSLTPPTHQNPSPSVTTQFPPPSSITTQFQSSIPAPSSINFIPQTPTETRLHTIQKPSPIQIRPLIRPQPPTPKLFNCPLCPMSFRRSHDLKRHTRSLHTKVKPYICVKCSKSFSRLDALKRHVARKSSPCFVNVAKGELLIVPPIED